MIFLPTEEPSIGYTQFIHHGSIFTTNAVGESPRRSLIRGIKGGSLKKEWLNSAGAVVLAFLASQHHNLHMLLLAIGICGAGMSFMTMFPVVRRVMLLLSLTMIGVVVFQVRNPKRPISIRIMGFASILVTLGFLIWSVMQFGI